jgi:uncharacterized protein YjbI with pentapeptide repeats
MALTYADSVTVLKGRVAIIGDALPEVVRVPRPDDDPVGPSIFRLRLEDVDLGGLCLPGLYVSRSELSRVSFVGAELRLAAFNWNDLLGCDFGGSDLRQADLRSSRFVRCRFDGAALEAADLRASTFEACSFVGARVEAALLQRGGLMSFLGLGRRGQRLPFSRQQRSAARWMAEAPAAPGG